MNETIAKLQEELEAAQADVSEKQRAFFSAVRKERAAANRLERAWAQQHVKIINTIKGITGDFRQNGAENS